MCPHRPLTTGLLLPVLVASAACAASGDAAEWSYEPQLTEPASFDADAALAAIHSAVVATGGRSPALVAAAWEEALAVSPSCPDYYAYGGTDYWLPCRERGRVFDGLVARYDYAAFSTAEQMYDGWYVYGEGTLTDNSSGGYRLGGTAYEVTEALADGSGAYAYGGIEGTFQYDGPAGLGTWLESGEPVDATWGTFTSSPPGAGWSWLTATVAGREGPYPDVELSLVELEAGATDCEIEPAGTISLRDTEGVWTDLVFDAVAIGSLSRTRGACDGCGRAWQNGEAIGDVCLDTPRLLGGTP